MYLHAGGPGIHAGVQYSDKHPSAIVLGEPGEIRRGAGFFFGEEPVKGERFFGRVSSHDQKRATMKTKQRNGEEEEEESNTVGETGRRAMV